MPSCKDVTIQLRVDGTAQEEYGVNTLADGFVECHIASQEDKTFALRVKNNLKDNRLHCKVLMDGVLMDKLGCPPRQTACSRGANTGSGYLPYNFKRLQVTDDESLADATGYNWDNIGVIELRCFRSEGSPTYLPPKRREPNVNGGPIHESSKKAGTHRVGLGHEVSHHGAARRYMNKLVDEESHPYAVVRFHYKPIEMLQAMGIAASGSDASRANKRAEAINIERRHRAKLSPQPIPDSSIDEDTKSAIVALEDEELATMQDQLRQLQARIAAKKASHFTIKREISPIRVSSNNRHEPLVIDLTDD